MSTQQPEPTLDDLKRHAGRLNIEGRSSMDKETLAQAITDREAELEDQRRQAQEDSQREAERVLREAQADQDAIHLPATPEEVGRPPLSEVAAQRAKRRGQTIRRIGDGTTTEED